MNVIHRACAILVVIGPAAQGCAADSDELQDTEVSEEVSAIVAGGNDDGKVDRNRLNPPLELQPNGISENGWSCALHKGSPICWVDQVVPYIARDWDVCPDGRTFYENSIKDSHDIRVYNKDYNLVWRSRHDKYRFFHFTFSPDGTGRRLTNNESDYVQIRKWPEPGNLSLSTATWTGKVDVVRTPENKVIVVDQGTLVEDQDFNILSSRGRWDFWNDYDLAVVRVCDALNAKK